MLATVSDRRLVASTDGTNVDYYDADVTSTAEYYPYGMTLRSETDGEGYRYGFNGQETDSEIKGEGNSINYKYRMHDPRIGRFFGVDPLTPKYPELTPYQFCSNSPIYMIEIEGLEGEGFHYKLDYQARALLTGRKTVEEYDQWCNAQGVGAVMALTILVDVYVTKGWLSRTVLFYAFGENMNATDNYNDAVARGDTESAAIYKAKMEETGMLLFTGILGELILPYALGKMAKIIFRSADEVNAAFIGNSTTRKAPWKSGSDVVEYTTKQSDEFVRVSGPDSNPKGNWIMKKSDIDGLTPQQIQDKYSLGYTPTKITDVKVGGGVKVQAGTAAAMDGNAGGGYQYYLFKGNKNVTYSNTKDL
ncbi:MAG: RHS repeat-associated protein [Crocinitomix sp.]